MSETQNNPIEQIFEMFSKGAMKSRPYSAKTMPHSITVTIKPETMELLHVISCRIGTTRAVVASHILQIGAVQAAAGCGFTVDEDEKIPESEKKWDVTPKSMGFSHIPEKEED